MPKKIFITLLLALCLWGTFGSVAFADNALVQCGRETDPVKAAQSCNFAQAVLMINNLITYLIYISLPLAAIAFAYAGWLRVSAGDNSGQITKSNHVFVSVGIGLIVILSGWLVFKLIQTTFLNTNNGYSTYLN